MATRFYLMSSGAIAPPTNPAFDAGWEQTGQATRLPMQSKNEMSAATALTTSGTITVPITTTQQILCYQFTSNRIFKPARLDASVLLSMVIRTTEAATSANAFLAYILRAFSADGGTVLATLASSMTNAGTEFTVAAQTRIFGNGTTTVALTAATLSEPWRLVLDLGAHAQAPTAAQSYTLRIGCDAASDFALTSALTTDLNPWIELSVNLDSLVGPQGFLSPRAGNGISVNEKYR